MSHKRDISTTTGENRCHGDKAPPAVFSCQRKRSLIRKTSSLAYRNHALGLVADWRQNNPQKSWSQWLLRLPPAESHQALRFRLSIITRHDRFEDRTRGQGKGARKVLKYGQGEGARQGARHETIPTVEPLLWDTSIQGTQNLVPEKCSDNLCSCYPGYWRDTSIQGTQNMVPEKCSRNLCICDLYWRDASIQGKGTTLLGPSIKQLKSDWPQKSSIR